MKNAEFERLSGLSRAITVHAASVFSYGLHTHTFYEMTLYEPFDGHILLNGQTVRPEGLTAVLICPGDFHEIIVRRPGAARFIKIGFNADRLTEELPSSPAVLSGVAPDSFLRRLFGEIPAAADDPTLQRLLLNTALHLLLRDGTGILSAASGGCETALAAARLLNEGFRGAITLESVARQLSVSPQHLSGVFSRNLNIRFSDYLLRLRLSHAERLITRTSMDMTEICFESGFGNYSHFSRRFRAHYGLSPRDYRNRAKNPPPDASGSAPQSPEKTNPPRTV